MNEHLEMWAMYFQNILQNPINIKVLVISITLSCIFYLLFRKSSIVKRKITYLGLHISSMMFPFVFAALFWRCMMPFANCSPKLIMGFGPIAGIIALVASFVFIPYLYRWSDKNHAIKNSWINHFVKNESEKLGIKEPELYFVNDAKPSAYSITNLKPSIFISIGLFEILKRKEMEAVLLHELYHHKSKAYFWKFSMNSLRLFTPLSTFDAASKQIRKEEIDADNYAIKIQGTSKYLNSAKKNLRASL